MNLEHWLEILLLPFIAYFLGSIPFGMLIARCVGQVDIRQNGSGNIGATNVRRTVGLLPAIVTLLGDIGKGFLPVWWAQGMVGPENGTYAQLYVPLVGLSAFAGHLFPVFLKGRTGGKGVATAAGVLMAISPGAVLVTGLVFILTACTLNRVSAASLAATAAMPLTVWYATGSLVLVYWAGLTAAGVWWRHWTNIQRLVAGNEPPIWKKDPDT